MKTKHYILFGTLGIAGYVIARFLINKFDSEEEYLGNLSKKEIESLYSKIKL